MDHPQFGHPRFALSSDHKFRFEWHVRYPQVQDNEGFLEWKFDLLHSLQIIIKIVFFGSAATMSAQGS